VEINVLTEQEYTAAYKRHAAAEVERKALLAKFRVIIKCYGNTYRVQFVPHAPEVSPSVSVWVGGPSSHCRQLRDHGIAYGVQIMARRKLKLEKVS
jgi:hypothetical protein